MTRIVATAVGRRLPAHSSDNKKVEILGVAGSGKSTVARLLGKGSGFAMGGFIHTRKPSHLLQVARGLPRVLPILAAGLRRQPRINWPEFKLLVYVTRWRLFLRLGMPSPETVLLFDQGPLYAMVRLKAEGKPFSTCPAFESWMNEMLEAWTKEMSVVIWLDAPDAVLWTRINERSPEHKKKGEDAQSGRDFIVRYRRSFEDLLHKMEEFGGPEVLRFDTSTATAQQIAETVGPLLRADRSAKDGPDPMPGHGGGGDRHG